MATVEVQSATAAFQEKSPTEQEVKELPEAVEALAVEEPPSKIDTTITADKEIKESAEEEKDSTDEAIEEGPVEEPAKAAVAAASEEVAAEPQLTAVTSEEPATEDVPAEEVEAISPVAHEEEETPDAVEEANKEAPTYKTE